MIPMPVTPNNAIDLADVDAAFLKDLAHVFLDVQAGNPIRYRCRCSRRQVPPILSASKIKQDGLSKFLVFYEEREGGHVHGLMALLDWLYECLGGHYNISRGVDDVDLDSISLGVVEV